MEKAWHVHPKFEEVRGAGQTCRVWHDGDGHHVLSWRFSEIWFKEIEINSDKKIIRFFIWLGVVLLQLIMTQVVTFLLSLLVPGMGNFGQTQPALFAVILGSTFSAGVILAGWLALKLHWLVLEPKYPARIFATLIGAYLPLVIALILYRSLEPGNPFFFISTLVAILGFHVPGWMQKK